MTHNFKFKYSSNYEFVILTIDPLITPASYVCVIDAAGMELSDTGNPQPDVDYVISPDHHRVKIIGVDII